MPTAFDIWDEYEVKDSEFPPTKKFTKPGDSIEGIIKRWSTVQTGDERTRVLEVEKEDGEVFTVWLSQTDLRRKLGSADLDEGDKVGISLKEVSNLDGGKTFKKFRCYHVPSGS